MVSDKENRRPTYELSPPQEVQVSSEAGSERSFLESLLVHNVWWFCQFRWLVIAVLLSYGVIGMFPRLIEPFDIRNPGVWPFFVGAILLFSNLTFLYMARTRTSPTQIMPNLWGQITVDLTMLTVVVYFIGSLDTNIAFTYLFHIVLSCVFFSGRQSFFVTVMAIGMFASCIIAEYVLKILPPMSIFASPTAREYASPVLTILAVDFFFTIGIWLVVC